MMMMMVEASLHLPSVHWYIHSQQTLFKLFSTISIQSSGSSSERHVTGILACVMTLQGHPRSMILRHLKELMQFPISDQTAILALSLEVSKILQFIC